MARPGETAVRWAQTLEEALIVHLTRLGVPWCSWARERKRLSKWELLGGRVARTQGLWRPFNKGPQRCLPAVVSGFQMILVSGDMPHALLADSSDHSFLWQPHRSRLQQLWARLLFHTPPFSSSIIYTHTHTNKHMHTPNPNLFFINIYTPRHIIKHNHEHTLTDESRRQSHW